LAMEKRLLVKSFEIAGMGSRGDDLPF